MPKSHMGEEESSGQQQREDPGRDDRAREAAEPAGPG